MADDRTLSAGEYGGHAPAERADPGVPDGVHATEPRMQPTGLHTPPDRRVIEAERVELRDTDDPALSLRDRRNPTDGAFLSQTDR